MIFFPLFKHNTWVKTLATLVHADVTFAVASNIGASLIGTVIQNKLTPKMIAHTPKILYINQNVENVYLVEPDFSTTVKGVRQNTLDIHITGLKMRYKSIFKYIYGLSFPSFM
jgi:hypothetical protein